MTSSWPCPITCTPSPSRYPACPNRGCGPRPSYCWPLCWRSTLAASFSGFTMAGGGSRDRPPRESPTNVGDRRGRREDGGSRKEGQRGRSNGGGAPVGRCREPLLRALLRPARGEPGDPGSPHHCPPWAVGGREKLVPAAVQPPERSHPRPPRGRPGVHGRRGHL